MDELSLSLWLDFSSWVSQSHEIWVIIMVMTSRWGSTHLLDHSDMHTRTPTHTISPSCLHTKVIPQYDPSRDCIRRDGPVGSCVLWNSVVSIRFISPSSLLTADLIYFPVTKPGVWLEQAAHRAHDANNSANITSASWNVQGVVPQAFVIASVSCWLLK